MSSDPSPNNYDGPIGDLSPAEQVNTILFRLAEALDYPVDSGVISADPDSILNEATETIWRYLDLKD